MVETIENNTNVKAVKPPSDSGFIAAMLTPTFVLFFAGIAIPLGVSIYFVSDYLKLLNFVVEIKIIFFIKIVRKFSF